MPYSSTLLLVALPVCLSFVAASPMHAAPRLPILEDRQVANCSDLHAVRSASCWDELNIPDYLTSWKANTPICANGDDGAKCCKPNEAWSTCFLRLATGTTGYDCTTITGSAGSCSSNHVATSTLSPDIVVKVSYVVSTMVTIQNIFAEHFSAWQFAQRSGNYTNLYNILYNDVMVNNGNLNKAVAAGLAFWGTPSVMAGGPQDNTDTAGFYSLAQTFAMSVQQTPGIGSAWWGAAYNINDWTYANFTKVPDIVTPLQAALSYIMNDVSVFNSFAAHGAYSGPQVNYWSGGHPGLIAPLTTYVVGEALAQNTFSASPMGTATKQAFQLGRNCTSAGDVCKDSSSTVYYWSSVTQMQYQISGHGNYVSLITPDAQTQLQLLEGEATTFGLMEFIENSATYMPVLFDGAYNCTLEGKAGGSAVNLNSDGSLDIACLSALPIYLAKGTPCPQGAVQVGGKCPFGYNK